MAENVIEFTGEDNNIALCHEGKRAVIVNPGALGDCILALPLAEYIKRALSFSSIDIIGQEQYLDFYPGRTCITNIHSIDSIQLYRFFVDHKDFSIEEKDPLAGAFKGYQSVVSFLGEKDSDFEQNLIFTVYSIQSADISILPMFADPDFSGHISDYYIRKFIEENDSEPVEFNFNLNGVLVHLLESDFQMGRQILASLSIKPDSKPVIIHPGSGGKKKCWHIDNFCAVASDLSDKGFQPVFLLGPAEKERFSQGEVQKFNAIAKTISSLNIKQVAQVIAASDGYIGNDCGVTHLAGAMGKETVAIFGPTDAGLYRPIGPKVAVLTPGQAGFDKYCQDSCKQVNEAFYELYGS